MRHWESWKKFDRVNETDYLYFLKQYFDMECSVSDTAKDMHLHRNSVTYKLHKIEEVLGMSVNTQSNRTRLMVAFMLKEIR